MDIIKTSYFFLSICCFPLVISAQFIGVNDTQNAIALVQKLTNTSTCISVSGEIAKGNPLSLTQNSYGVFNKNSSDFPFSSGIVLSTWVGKNSEGPYTNAGGGIEWAGDADINTVLGINSKNASSLEFDFIAQTNFLSFNYIFASNEYIKDNPCKYSDGLALLIKDVTMAGSYRNLAILPDGTTVSSKNIHPAINYSDAFTNTKCDAINEAYFGQFNSTNPNSSAVNYAGQTIPLTAKTTLISGHTYHIKLVIANDRDNDNNSAVFVESGSFSAKINLGTDRLLATNNALCFGESFVLNTGLTGLHKWTKTNSSGTTTLSETSNSLTINQEGLYKVEVTNGATSCIFLGEIKIEYLPSLALNNATISKCDDNGNGYTFFDLTSVKSIITNTVTDISLNYYEDSSLTSIINTPSEFQKNRATDQVVFAKGTNSKGCSEIATITLNTLPSSFNANTLPAPIIKEFSGKENSIELIAPTATGNYEFSIDGIFYQPNRLFTGLTKGDYTAYIRNKTSCEYATYPFTILDYPKFFTPNGDGFNDFWKIAGLEHYPQSVLYIFDRYGKLLKQLDKSSVGWNGTFNGHPLPATDYWFRLTLNENQIVNGHFSLKR